MNELTVMVGGQAGQGANVIGRTLGKIFLRSGYYVVGYPEYPSLVRGGHNAYQIRAGKEKIHGQVYKSNILVAMDKESIFFHHNYLSEPSAIIYDSSWEVESFKMDKKIKKYPLPIQELLTQAGANPKMINVLLCAALLALIKYPLEPLNKMLEEEFSRKGKEIVEANQKVAKLGYDYMIEKLKAEEFPLKMEATIGKAEEKILLTGNNAIGLGAVAGGMTFYAAYPMTPASEVLHYLARVERDAGIVVKHTEDEIAAINYAAGAAFAGARAMTGSSGGGFALMVETLGMAAMAETPLVIYLAQRTGPSTGLPTWTEQADLKFALNASQGDFLRVVIAPGSVSECFYLTAEAFNLAEKYQLPVIILSDKFLAETNFTSEKFDSSKIKVERGKIAKNISPGSFKRYEFTKDGVSARSFPGEANGMHVASSYEHDETGFSSESFTVRADIVEKRARKIDELIKEIPAPKIYGPKEAEVTLICWGSQLLPVLDALKIFEKEKVSVNVIHFNFLFPLNEKKVNDIFSKCKKTIMVENNSTAQFAGVLREYTGFVPDVYLLRYDGRQFFPENIVEKVKEMKKKKFKEKRVIVRESEDLEYYYTPRFNIR